MIYTDGIHLMSEDLIELHKFAESIGLKKCWFHGVRKGHPHYDLSEKKRLQAIQSGAILVSSKELVRLYKCWKSKAISGTT